MRIDDPATICFCTSYSADAEPRARRHAAAFARANPDARVLFIDCAPLGQRRRVPEDFQDLANLTYLSCAYPWSGAGRARRLFDKVRCAVARGVFRTTGVVPPMACSARARYLTQMLRQCRAQAYVGYNIDSLIPMWMAAHHHGAYTAFDCMEFYSDMGDGQTALERQICKAVESRYLSRCHLVTASSEELARALEARYGVRDVLPVYNAAPRHESLPQEQESTFALYWRNAVIGLSQRGLGDVLTALVGLPPDVTLHIRGKLPADRGRALRKGIAASGLQDRVFIHPPHHPGEAVLAAARYTVGVCPEQVGPENQALTVSNKIFDFLMAGLPVVASDLPGLRSILERANAGLVFRSRDPDDLRSKILQLYENRDLLRRLSSNARAFALNEGNLESEMKKFCSAVSDALVARGHSR